MSRFGLRFVGVGVKLLLLLLCWLVVVFGMKTTTGCDGRTRLLPHYLL